MGTRFLRYLLAHGSLPLREVARVPPVARRRIARTMTFTGKFTVGRALATEAHSVAVDPATHLVYFPLQSGSRGRPELLIVRPA